MPITTRSGNPAILPGDMTDAAAAADNHNVVVALNLGTLTFLK